MSELMKKLYEISDEDVKAVKQYYERSETDVRRDCWLIEAWMKKQTHFPNDYDENRIGRVLLRNKFRLEQTKQKLENYYTVKGFNIAIFKSMDPLDPTIQQAFNTVQILPMPKLMNKLERIYIHRYSKNDANFSMMQDMLLMFALCELELNHDYAIGIRIVVDSENLSSTHLKALHNVNMLAKLIFMYQECLSGRILGIHVVNASPVLNLLLDIFKIALPEKLYKKIIVHNNMESLKSIIPEDFLPSDYEGKMRSCDDIYDDVKTLLIENRDYLLKRVQCVADESKRVGQVKKNDLFGVDGTFKNINID